MATEKKMSPEILSKTARQISVYFKKAYENALKNKAVLGYQNGQWSKILLYQSIYFEASSW